MSLLVSSTISHDDTVLRQILLVLAEMFSVMVLKLASSLDDVLWLSAYLTDPLPPIQKIIHALIYLTVITIITITAFLISLFSGDFVAHLIENLDPNLAEFITIQRILTLAAAAILLLYAVVLGIEYQKETKARQANETLQTLHNHNSSSADSRSGNPSSSSSSSQYRSDSRQHQQHSSSQSHATGSRIADSIAEMVEEEEDLPSQPSSVEGDEENIGRFGKRRQKRQKIRFPYTIESLFLPPNFKIDRREEEDEEEDEEQQQQASLQLGDHDAFSAYTAKRRTTKKKKKRKKKSPSGNKKGSSTATPPVLDASLEPEQQQQQEQLLTAMMPSHDHKPRAVSPTTTTTPDAVIPGSEQRTQQQQQPRPQPDQSHSEVDYDADKEDNSIRRRYHKNYNPRSPRPLVTVAFVMSLDDMVLFVPMLMGGAFGIIELLVGALLASLLLIAICLFLNQSKSIARFLEQIPLFAIVGVFAVILLLRGIFVMQ